MQQFQQQQPVTEAAKESGIFPSVTFEQRKTKSKLATTVLHFPIGVCEAAAEASKAAVAEQKRRSRVTIFLLEFIGKCSQLVFYPVLFICLLLYLY